MKFISNAGVFIVIAAFVACAVVTGAPSGLRQRRTATTLACDSQGNCVASKAGRMKREDSNIDNVELADDEQTGDSLRLRLRRCVDVHKCDSVGNCAWVKVCRMKREDFDVLDAAMGVYEDASPAGDNVESADEEQTDAPSGLRQRRTVSTAACDSQGNCGTKTVGQMKPADFTTQNNNGARTRRSNNCQWQCVCTVNNGGNGGSGDSAIYTSTGRRTRRTVDMWGGSSDGQTSRTTITSGRCATSSSNCQSTCN